MSPRPLLLNDSLGSLHSIADKLVRDFKNLGISNIGDLLWYFPWRYDDLSQISSVADISEEKIYTLRVRVKSLKSYRSWRQKMIITEMLAGDSTGDIKIFWFHQKFIARVLKIGDEIYLSGKAQKTKHLWQMTSPIYEKVKDRPLHSARLVPIYHLSGQITQKQLRFLIDQALKKTHYSDDPLPSDLLSWEKYPGQQEALQAIHFPSSQEKLDTAIARLKFQELLYLQLKYQLAKKDYQSQSTFSVLPQTASKEEVIKNLPFKLTPDQEQVLGEIEKDLAAKQPMNRLVEGDVGSGKTIVALLAALNAVASGRQAALMAPTEILASQHFATAGKIWPKAYRPHIALYTRSQNKMGKNEHISRTELLTKIKSGQARLIIGTHSLIQEKINFAELALVIIDEQHRFGVRQRQELKKKNPDHRAPHLLSLTATPIPRTLALTLYGDLDISLIKEKPAGRQPVKTFLVPEKKRADAYKFIRGKITAGQQAFVICPLIDAQDKLGLKTVTAELKKLQQDIFPDFEIRAVHGQLKTESKEKIMADFQDNKFPLLVATSVIEVGVDVPGATIVLIESAERFGLSQLHQFRGRIGRNNWESFCLLFTSDDSQLSTRRLRALAASNDGFRLAEMDLELRGGGEIFGTQQTGLMPLKIAQLSDTPLIKKSQDWAKKLLHSPRYRDHKHLQTLLQNLKTEMHLE